MLRRHAAIQRSKAKNVTAATQKGASREIHSSHTRLSQQNTIQPRLEGKSEAKWSTLACVGRIVLICASHDEMLIAGAT